MFDSVRLGLLGFPRLKVRQLTGGARATNRSNGLADRVYGRNRKFSQSTATNGDCGKSDGKKSKLAKGARRRGSTGEHRFDTERTTKNLEWLNPFDDDPL